MTARKPRKTKSNQAIASEKKALARMAQRARQKPKKKRLIVHLGNIDDFRKIRLSWETRAKPREAAKTAEYADRFQGMHFIGIDQLELKETLSQNWTQFKADFKEGLERLKDNSVDLISSEMSLGYYGPKFEGIRQSLKGKGYKKHTYRTMEVAFRKLKRGGKIHIVVAGTTSELIVRALKRAGFEEKKIKVELLPPTMGKTRWLKGPARKQRKRKFYHIVAVK